MAARHSGRGSAYRFTLRLLGIDTPEITGASADEKRVARAARDVLSEMVLGEMVKIDVSAGFDKYGRLLAVVTHDIHGDVAQVLVQKGYAGNLRTLAADSWKPCSETAAPTSSTMK